MTGPELEAEGKRRFLRSNPTITAEAFDTWLAAALSKGATVVLQIDGCRAEYETESAAASKVRAAKGVT